jgi:hypothetical protein
MFKVILFENEVEAEICCGLMDGIIPDDELIEYTPGEI